MKIWIAILSFFFLTSVQAQKGTPIPSPLIVNGDYIADLTVTAVNDEFFIRGGDFKDFIAPKVRKDLIAGWQFEEELWPVKSLQAEGLLIRYNEERLHLEVFIQPQAKSVNRLGSTRPSQLAYTGRFVEAAPVSGYLNFRGTQNFVDDLERGNLFGDLEGVLNVKKWVVESRWTYTEGESTPWQQGEQRLIRDDEKKALRYTLGDLNFTTRGFQRFQSLGGLSLTKNYAIQPYKITTPVGRRRFFLARDSRVRVIVNGRLFRQFELSAGEHDLQDLPVVQGLNDVVLEIENEVGETERIDFSYLSESEMLPAGFHEYSYNLGFPAEAQSGRRDYETSEPTLTLFHRWGLSSDWTLGGNFQGNDQQMLFGGEAFWATSLGLWAWEPALSQSDISDWDWGSRWIYKWVKESAGTRVSRSLNVTAEYVGQSFAGLGELDANNNFSWRFDTAYAQPIFTPSLRLGTSFRHSLARAGEDSSSLSLSASYFGFRGHQLSLDLTHPISGDDETRVFLSWLWNGDNPRNYLLATHDSSGPVSELEVQQTIRPSVGQLDVGARTRNEDGDQVVGLSFDYIDQRFVLLGDYEVGAVNDQSRLTFGSAIAFAGPQVTLSRPIVDSFALIRAKPHLKGQRIPINSQGDFAQAEINFWDTAVLPNLTSYHNQPILLDSSYLKEGYLLGEENLIVKPSFRSGVSVEVGTDATVFIRGRLLDPEGRPMALKGGEIVSVEGGKEPVLFFTNRRGEFGIEGLSSGLFEIKLFESGWKSKELSISDQEAGIAKLGDLQVERDE